jgi:O-antigen biosynthesis protein WbqV
MKLPPALRNAVAAGHDGLMAGLSFVLAIYLRLGDDQFAQASGYLVPGTMICAAITLSVCIWLRLYRGLWRYASLRDVLTILKAVSISIALFYLLLFIQFRLQNVPRSAPLIHWLVLVALLIGPRFAYRALKDGALSLEMIKQDATRQIPVLLVGANDSADLFLRELAANPHAEYRAVGMLDANPALKGKTLRDVRIYGGPESMPHIVAKLARKGLKPQRLVVADDRIEGEALTALLDLADQLGMAVGRLPRLSEFKEGAAGRAQIRPIALEDLLGRAQNVHDRGAMSALIADKRVLVTGAGGSIGGELARQIAGYGPSELVLFEQSEYALYSIDQELAVSYPDIARAAVLGDVRDAVQVRGVWTQRKPEIVFHAAAIKHVPLAEHNPLEAVATNVIGTRHVADACREAGAAAMVLISTDKAVHPTNVMGASKRLAERYCQSLRAQAGATRFITVRFGNVLGSAGSVVPLFQQQLARGGPLTVTHPDMVRYFMTIREAVELVLAAAALGSAKGGAATPLYVLDMGTPVKIVDLARQMVRLAGLSPEKDIAISFTGLRPGEKLYEELFYAGEQVTPTAHASIRQAQPEMSDAAALHTSLDLLARHVRERDAHAALRLFSTLVPEYTPS